ncbi:hypothetical protein [Enterococcus faecalis]|uniref:hypothetical protein n=1 Tax=Enterococcus faecalis TaxID=1351 RepID=UPI00206B7BFC|nr:hypothetical protein [Enterococcus faecalis]BDH63982.1 hypothetical protein MTP05_01670 [Enterococcus sp. PLM3]
MINSLSILEIFVEIIYIAWFVCYMIQSCLVFGVAYRKTKANGDNGMSLFGWLTFYQFAALIPYVGIYLWKRSKEEGFK